MVQTPTSLSCDPLLASSLPAQSLFVLTTTTRMSTTTTKTTTHHGSSSFPLEPLEPLEPLTPRHATPTASLPPSPTADSQPSPPPTPLLKLLSIGLSFFVAGLNDGALGALIPHLLRSYGITTALVSVLYAGTLAGWVVAAFTSTHLAQRLRLGSLLALGAALQTAAHALRCGWEAPFGVFVAGGFVASLGQAWQDTWGNTFVASLATVAPTTGEGGEEGAEGKKGKGSVHRWLGFIHAMYMAGSLVAPFGAASIAAGGRWWLYYTVPLGLGVVNLALVLVAFRDSLGFEEREKSRTQAIDGDETQVKKSASGLIKDALSQKNVWLLGLFFFFYLGVVVTAGGWVVEYLVDVRNGDIAQMGYVPAGFSGGCLLGRILLPEPTHRFGEKKMVFIYCVFCFAFQLLFWL